MSTSAPRAAPGPGTPAARPGQAGSAIIAGHIDSDRGPGVFFRPGQLRPGDRIYVRHADGTLAVFRACAEHMFAKDHSPIQKVYGPAPDPGTAPHHLRRVFDAATGSYLSNVVVYAAQIR